MKFLIIFATFIALASARGARITKGECFGRNDNVFSDRGCFRMVLQDDGNMVIYRQSDNSAAWSTGTNGKGGHQACMQRKRLLLVN